MRKPLLAGNWKMYKTIPEALDLVRQLKNNIREFWEQREVLVCPPFTALSSVRELVKDTPIRLGAQNLYPREEGAYTGEISPKMLVDVGCEYVILGHSERRQYFNESNQFINEKVKTALRHELKPILCVGETLEQRESGLTEQVVEKQVLEGLEDVSEEEMGSVVIAYEPVWAIGTGRTARPEDANEVQGWIRGWLAQKYNSSLAENVRILYGGSVKPENVDELMAQPHIDGALVGGASLKAESFSRIVGFQKHA